MGKFLDFINTKIKPYSIYITTFIVIIIFSIVGYYTFISILNKNTGFDAKFSDVANNGINSGEVDIKLFYVDWCPYCKTALPEWQSFCDEYKGKVVNKFTISCNRNGTNCTDDNSPEVKAIIAKYDIKSYPTVIMFKDNKRYDYDAKVTKNSLEKFIQTVTKDE